jgi:hypothetical protein
MNKKPPIPELETERCWPPNFWLVVFGCGRNCASGFGICTLVYET